MGAWRVRLSEMFAGGYGLAGLHGASIVSFASPHIRLLVLSSI